MLQLLLEPHAKSARAPISSCIKAGGDCLLFLVPHLPACTEVSYLPNSHRLCLYGESTIFSEDYRELQCCHKNKGKSIYQAPEVLPCQQASWSHRTKGLELRERKLLETSCNERCEAHSHSSTADTLSLSVLILNIIVILLFWGFRLVGIEM